MIDDDGAVSLPLGAEFAAGGLVWRSRENGVQLGIVQRENHPDWSLPKGRPKENDASLKETAKREAMEELGIEVDLGDFAGSYSYVKDGKPKVVFIWHMWARDQPSNVAPDPGEIRQPAWLTTGDAITQLTHQTEKDFVARHPMPQKSGRVTRWSSCISERLKTFWSHIRKHPELDRLEAEMGHVREQLQATMARDPSKRDAWWVSSVHRSLARAGIAWREKKVDPGWAAVHDAARFLVFGMTDEELKSRALSLRAEVTVSGKLGHWRKKATANLFQSIALDGSKTESAPLDDGQAAKQARREMESVVVEALCVLNESGQNSYHRIRLVGQQMRYLIWIGCVLLALLLLAPLVPRAQEPDLSRTMLSAVALFGAGGATLTALYQLSRAGDTKIPESTLHGVITLGRPLVGALSALFIYVALRSKVVGLIKPEDLTVSAALTLAFTAGFTEHYIVRTIATVTGGGGTGGTDPNQEKTS